MSLTNLMEFKKDLFKGGICPHHYCLPIVKAEKHRQKLVDAVQMCTPKLFLGTDSAPHSISSKESACGCAGIYNPYSIEILTQFFEEEGMLDVLEPFTSEFGATFYGLPLNETTLTLVNEPWVVPESVSVDGGIPLRPFYANRTVTWCTKPY